MRKIYSLFVITVLLISCGEKKTTSIESLVSIGNLKELEAKKKEIATNLEIINKDLLYKLKPQLIMQLLNY